MSRSRRSAPLLLALSALLVTGVIAGMAGSPELPSAPVATTAAPLPGPTLAGTIAARKHFFGAEHVNAATGAVDDSKVILSWFSVGSLAASIRGHVALLDTYIHKAEDAPNYVPTTYDELVDLDPELIFIGHGHFDHGYRAGEIALRAGASVFGTPEHCDQIQDQAQHAGGADAKVPCHAVVARGAAPGASSELDVLGRDVCITAMKHLHSAAEPPEQGHQHDPVVAVPDPSAIIMHPPGPSAVNHVDGGGDEGGSLLYQFRTGDFSLTWHDSAGPLKENNPEVFELFRHLPVTDVEVGAILGFNQPFNGLRDPAMYIDAIDPKIFVPLHHDFVTEYGSANDYEPTLRKELAGLGPLPELRWLSDPGDYIRPGLLTFDIDAPQWSVGDSARPIPDKCKKPKD